MGAPDRYALFGHPVAHSRSPDVHRHFAAITGETLVYEKVDPGADGFAEALGRFLDAGGRGGNVTLPFKLQAAALADSLTPRAREAGSVNTFRLEADGSVLGDNTDGAGLVRDIEGNLGFRLEGRRVLILGAGGAAHGAAGPLLAAGIESLHVANRRQERAERLADRFRLASLVTGGPLDPIPEGGFDLIINATSASVYGQDLELPGTLIRDECLCYDMAYAEQGTPFTHWAERHGARAADGWGMMVEQAAESFFVWRGVRPETGELVRKP
jgi:shikimate dehydrogenase